MHVTNHLRIKMCRGAAFKALNSFRKGKYQSNTTLANTYRAINIVTMLQEPCMKSTSSEY